MPTRRHFLRSLFATTAALPALRSDALARIRPTVQSAAGRSPGEIAQDEDFWRDIQAAFDIDRGMINLNNGGVGPSPRIRPTVQSAAGRSPGEIAQDEDFWRDIQAAFDIDRGMINLNNGGVAPSPRVVNAAFQ